MTIKSFSKTALAILLLVIGMISAMPAAAQGFAKINRGPLNGNCNYAPTLGIDRVNGNVYWCADSHVWRKPANLLAFQGVTATAITTTAFTALTGPSLAIPASQINVADKTVRIRFSGVYTTGAASVLNTEIALCTVSGCASGTVLSPAGCTVISTNQANVLANGQFDGECLLTTASTGATGTLMAKATSRFNLGATTAVALSGFADTATAVSAAVDLTVAEYVHPRFKFTTSNAGNTATLMSLTVEILN